MDADAPPADVIDWTRAAVEQLVGAVGEKKAQAILARCACRYPVDDLQDVREAYEASSDLDVAHRMLQDRFERFLRDVLELDDELIDDILARGWGLAGVREGSTIIATKIPKSGNLLAYMEETNSLRRRQLYCHCPRVRELLSSPARKWPQPVAKAYCHCGAGFYQGIWEEIVQAPVQVKVLESVLTGDEVCRIAIQIPRPVP